MYNFRGRACAQRCLPNWHKTLQELHYQYSHSYIYTCIVSETLYSHPSLPILPRHPKPQKITRVNRNKNVGGSFTRNSIGTCLQTCFLWFHKLQPIPLSVWLRVQLPRRGSWQILEFVDRPEPGLVEQCKMYLRKFCIGFRRDSALRWPTSSRCVVMIMLFHDQIHSEYKFTKKYSKFTKYDINFRKFTE